MKLFVILLALTISTNCYGATIIPVSGTFDTYYGMSGSDFYGTVTVFDKKTGAVDLVIGDDGPGLTQEFHLTDMNNFSFDGSLDFALLWQFNDNGSGAIIDVDAVDIYDDGPFYLVDLRLTIWDDKDNFSAHWEWDNGRNHQSFSVPEPARLFISGLTYLGLWIRRIV